MKCNFTAEHYSECIKLAQDKGYEIGRIRDYEHLGKKYILLRHDVDFSVDYAYRMALLDKDLGVSSTFFILLHSTTYNAMSPHNQDLIKRIAGMGHEIGWQIDTRYQLPHEEHILEYMIKSNVISYAQHYFTLTDKPKEDWGIDAMNWKKLKVKYLSESSRNWREGCMCRWLEEEREPRLEVLTHPIWWMTDTQSRKDAIDMLHNDLHISLIDAIVEYKQIVKNYLGELGIEFSSDDKQQQQQLRPQELLDRVGENLLAELSEK